MLLKPAFIPLTVRTGMSRRPIVSNTKLCKILSCVHHVAQWYSDCTPGNDEFYPPYHKEKDVYERFVSEFCSLHDMELPSIAIYLCVWKHC